MAACGTCPKCESMSVFFFRDPNRFVYCQEEIHCGQNYCGKSCYCQYYPAITDILQKKILEYLFKKITIQQY
ncbi:hypothetical protein MEW_02712 [Candida albicans P60002]|nr:hypothetical protein MEW_02712 [Candida albicans P60002]